MKIKKTFLLRNVADTWVVIPTGADVVDFNRLMHLNDSAAFLWRNLEKGLSKEKLLAVFMDEYDIPMKQAEMDIEEFIDDLRELSILI